jgi:hypothetical protein
MRPASRFASIIVDGGYSMAKEHTKNQRPSNYDKHTAKQKHIDVQKKTTSGRFTRDANRAQKANKSK